MREGFSLLRSSRVIIQDEEDTSHDAKALKKDGGCHVVVIVITTTTMSETRYITFGARMRRSYRVTLPPGMKYKNARDPHVEVSPGIDIPIGETFPLGERKMARVHGNIAVMYDVVGVMNGAHTAHVTVYFGPDENEAAMY
jgi:hypothetical protein